MMADITDVRLHSGAAPETCHDPTFSGNAGPNISVDDIKKHLQKIQTSEHLAAAQRWACLHDNKNPIVIRYLELSDYQCHYKWSCKQHNATCFIR